VSDDADDLTVLLGRTAKGDRASFQALYRKTAPKLFGLVLRIVRDKSTAEDILQDTYVRVWRNAESYSSSAGEPLGWLASIARNGAIDILRKRTPVTFGKDDDAEDYFERIMDPHDKEAAMIALDALRHCLREIEAPMRDCVLLAYYEGYSREELANRFGRPVNTIKTWLHRGLAALKTCLETQR
jgi:RNA polymerase sigma-70 factor, ECF subfamily